MYTVWLSLIDMCRFLGNYYKNYVIQNERINKENSKKIEEQRNIENK